MTFDEWWGTLTTKEQNMIGVNNARFIWSSACEECAKLCQWRTGIQHVDAAIDTCAAAIRALGRDQ